MYVPAPNARKTALFSYRRHQMGTKVTTGEPDSCENNCKPVAEVLNQIAGKWTIFVITHLSGGPMRFSELKRETGGISQKVLTATLRDLERNGFVTRKVTPTIPPRVDYELTEMGHELREPLATIRTWADANRERVDAARQRFAEQVEEQKRYGSW
jgi:DNA-binding HxlR family transcriptional regulator